MNIFLAVTAFTSMRAGGLSGMPIKISMGAASVPRVAFGLLMAMSAILASVMASIVGERQFEKHSDMHAWTSLAHVKVGEAIVAFIMMSLVPGAPLPLKVLTQRPMAMFTGFGRLTWPLIVALILDGWMSVLIVKRLNSVVKALAKCASMIALYLLSIWVFRTDVFVLSEFILALLVTTMTYQFVYATLLQRKEEKIILRKPQSDEMHERLEEVFRQYEVEDRGTVMSTDLPDICKELGAKVEDKRLKSLMAEFGLSREGPIKLEDLKFFWSSTPGLGGYAKWKVVAIGLRLSVIDSS